MARGGIRRRQTNASSSNAVNTFGAQQSAIPIPAFPAQFIDSVNSDLAYAQGVEAAANDTIEKSKTSRP